METQIIFSIFDQRLFVETVYENLEVRFKTTIYHYDKRLKKKLQPIESKYSNSLENAMKEQINMLLTIKLDVYEVFNN